MLRLKQAELKQQLVEGQHRLTAVTTHLNYIQEEQTVPDYDVIVKPVDTIRHVVTIRKTILLSVNFLMNSQPMLRKIGLSVTATAQRFGMTQNLKNGMLMRRQSCQSLHQ